MYFLYFSIYILKSKVYKSFCYKNIKQFLSSVADVYEKIATIDKERFEQIDASQSEENVKNEVKSVCAKYITN